MSTQRPDADSASMKNVDTETVASFGREWTSFDQRRLDETNRRRIFGEYFRIVPWDRLPREAVAADIGCGTGRWAALVATRVRTLYLVDASREALEVARKNLDGVSNCVFIHASVDELPLDDVSLDFAFSLGVLHHVPDPSSALRAIAAKLKPGAPFLVYLYYAFDNRPAWFRVIWRASDLWRKIVCRLPYPLKYGVTQLIALSIYWPLARMAGVLARWGALPAAWPLGYYRDKSLYVMRTDALDRFGTPLEQRFTRSQIVAMLHAAGFERTTFSDQPPYWCALSWKR